MVGGRLGASPMLWTHPPGMAPPIPGAPKPWTPSPPSSPSASLRGLSPGRAVGAMSSGPWRAYLLSLLHFALPPHPRTILPHHPSKLRGVPGKPALVTVWSLSSEPHAARPHANQCS